MSLVDNHSLLHNMIGEQINNVEKLVTAGKR
jgi:hypothetical protein